MNSFEEIKVDKRPHARCKRIDPVDAAIDAHFVRMTQLAEQPVDEAAAALDWLAMMSG